MGQRDWKIESVAIAPGKKIWSFPNGFSYAVQHIFHHFWKTCAARSKKRLWGKRKGCSNSRTLKHVNKADDIAFFTMYRDHGTTFYVKLPCFLSFHGFLSIWAGKYLLRPTQYSHSVAIPESYTRQNLTKFLHTYKFPLSQSDQSNIMRIGMLLNCSLNPTCHQSLICAFLRNEIPYPEDRLA